MVVTDTNPTDYINSLSEELRADMTALDKAITTALPGVERVMWEGKFWGGSEQKIIGYGVYKYKGKSGRGGEWFAVGLAQQKNYITVFINAVEDDMYLVEKHKGSLGKVKAGKSTVSFTKLVDVNLDKLLELVKKAPSAMIAAT